MARVFSVMGEVDLNTTKCQASLQELEATKAKIPLTLEAKQARRQAESMLGMVDRLDRKTARPKVDGSGIQKAKTQAESLDKALDKAARARKADIKTELTNLTTAFGAGQSVRGGGLSGLMYGAGALSGLGGAGLAMAGAGAAAAVAAAGAGSMFGHAMQGQKMEAFMGRAYGAQGEQFVATAKQLAEATGFLSTDFMRAALIGKTLVANYGLQTDQITKLVAVSADLAATSPYEDIQTASNAMERLQSAIRGEAEASERLGLTLNDTYMRNMAADGAYRQTWTTMNDLEKAQARYKEILVQTQDVLGAAEDKGLSNDLRMAKQRFTEAGAALTEKLIVPLSKLVELAAKIPAGVWEGAMWGGMALGGGLLGRGAYRMGRTIVGRVGAEVGERAIADAAASAAGKVAAKAATKAAAAAATEAATTAASEVVAKAAGDVSGKLISSAATSAIASVGGLAAIAAAAGLVVWTLTRLAAETDAAYAEAEQRDERRLLLQRYEQQRHYGMDWGVYRDASGNLVQGNIAGWDQAAGKGFRTQTMMVEGKPRSGMIVGSDYTYNKFGVELGTPYYGQNAKLDVNVTLQNQSNQPLRATDARAYELSNY